MVSYRPRQTGVIPINKTLYEEELLTQAIFTYGIREGTTVGEGSPYCRNGSGTKKVLKTETK